MNTSIFGSDSPKFVSNPGTESVNFTANASTNLCTAASPHNFTQNQKIRLTTTGTLPAPLTVLTDYWAYWTNSTIFVLSLTSNGAIINITDSGTGTHSFLKETGEVVLLDYWKPIKDSTEDSRATVNESQLTAERFILSRGGDFWEFSGVVHLYKHEVLATIRSKFEEIYAYNHQYVGLYKHKDGDFFRDADDAIILFYLECFPGTINDSDLLDYRDVLYVTFRSLKAPDFANIND